MRRGSRGDPGPCVQRLRDDQRAELEWSFLIRVPTGWATTLRAAHSECPCGTTSTLTRRHNGALAAGGASLSRGWPRAQPHDP